MSFYILEFRIGVSMPLYTFTCEGCGRVVELRQPANAPLIDYGCKECGGAMKRNYLAPAKPVFKGTGFYETDYKAKESSNDNTKDL